MLYLVEAHASIEQGDRVDSGDGPGPIFAKIVERFHPEAMYGNPTRRQVFLIVNLDTPDESRHRGLGRDCIGRREGQGDLRARE